jgi:hypothetical protein
MSITHVSGVARPVHRGRLLELALTLAMVVWLSACGPGVGGTGTGETNGLAYFGAKADSVCTADVGSVLGCVAGAGAAPATPVTSAAPVFLADALASPGVQARVQDSAIDLSVVCTGLRFRGQWGELAGLSPRFFGNVGPEGAQQPATLQVQAAAVGTTGVVVTLRDAAGVVLLGPTLLLVVPAPATALACG